MEKFTKKFLYYKITLGYLYLLFFLFYVSFQFLLKLDLIYIVLISLALFILNLIYQILYYNKSGYIITRDSITVKKGVFFKKESVLTFDKMHAINTKQGLIQKLFNLQGIFIDSGSTNTASQAEIVIYVDELNKEEIITLLEEKLKKETNTNVSEEKDVDFKFSFKEKLMLSLLNVIVILFLAILIYISFIIGMFLITISSSFFVVLTICVALSILLVFAFSMFVIMFMYYDYQIKVKDNYINIKYGLFVRVDNTIQKNKIKAVRIKRGIIKRMFGYAQITIDVVGYQSGSNNGQDGSSIGGVFIPFCKYRDVDKYIESLLPEYKTQELTHKSKSYSPHIKMQVLLTFIVYLVFQIPLLIGYLLTNDETTSAVLFIMMIVLTAILLLSIVLVLIDSIFRYHNAKISISDEKIQIQNGSFIQTNTIILKENIIAVEDVTTYFRAKKGITTYIIHIFSNAMFNRIRVDILDDKLKDELNALLFKKCRFVNDVRPKK